MRAVVYLALLPMIAVAYAQKPQPRADVGEIAAVIEANYYDEERGRIIANKLVREVEKGAFDGSADRRALALMLTTKLRNIDRHFKVHWGEAPSNPVPRRNPEDSNEQSEDAQFGFTRVERLSGNVAYIELTGAADIDFADASSPARSRADAVLKQVRDARALILDLRQNRGGSPAMVGYLVSAFVAPTEDVYNRFHTRDLVLSERPAQLYANPMREIPLFVLVGPGTASAAESLAYTLQACGRAVIVGERTAGAANPGAPFVTPSGYSVFVSTGSPRNPLTGRNWEAEGVRPDASTPASEALAEARALIERRRD